MRSKLRYRQLAALKWLANRGGEGGLVLGGLVVAGGAVAPVARRTWLYLEKSGYLMRSGKRVKLAAKAASLDLSGISEAKAGRQAAA